MDLDGDIIRLRYQLRWISRWIGRLTSSGKEISPIPSSGKMA